MNEYFEKYQFAILKLLNTPGGKALLNIKDKSPILLATPSSIHFGKDYYFGKVILQGVFYSSNRISEILMPILDAMDIALYDALKRNDTKVSNFLFNNRYKAFLHYAGLENYKLPHIYLNLGNYTDKTGEGRVENSGATWAGTQSSASGNNNFIEQQARVAKIAANLWVISRQFNPFDTSTIGSGATVTAAVFKGFRDDAQAGGFANTDSTTVEVIPSSQASDTSLANSDYSNITFSSKGSLALSSTSNNTQFSITLSSPASLVNVTGTTKLAAILGLDLSNTAPTGANSLSLQTRSQTNPPTLTVTYTPAASGRIGKGLLGMMGVGN